MSDDNKNSDPFDDIDFDSFNSDESQVNTGADSFDLDNPFGDDVVVSRSEASAEEDAFDFDNTLGDAPGAFDDAANAAQASESPDADAFDVGGGSFGGAASLDSESGVSADNPYLSDGVAGEAPKGKKKGKKGLLGGLLGGKGKSKKEKTDLDAEEESEDGDEPKKGTRKKREKVVKEKKPAGERTPLELGDIICFVFLAIWLVCMLTFNIAGFLTGEPGRLMQTLCFMGAINIVGLVLASVPLLFYRFPKERTLPNVMLGVAVVALFTGVMITLTEFYRYGFMLSP